MLSEEDRAILEFERGWWHQPGPKDMAIELTLGLPAAAYYEHLLDLVSRPETAALDPLVVKRIEMMIGLSLSVEEAAS